MQALLAMPTLAFASCNWCPQTQLAMNNNEQGQVANCVAIGHHTTNDLEEGNGKRKGGV